MLRLANPTTRTLKTFLRARRRVRVLDILRTTDKEHKDKSSKVSVVYPMRFDEIVTRTTRESDFDSTFRSFVRSFFRMDHRRKA